MTLEFLRSNYRGDILAAARECGARNVKVFGSTVRGEQTDQSDLDILVDFEETRSLFDLVELSQRLQELLGMSIDIVTTDALRSNVRDRILNEAVPL